jgi:hypothetical protein
MISNKKDLSELSTRVLLNRRRRLAAGIGDVEQILAGSLIEHMRRCGKSGCRCAQGIPHGPYTYVSPRPPSSRRLVYVPAALTDVAARYLRRHAELDGALGEISAINAELLARRELS